MRLEGTATTQSVRASTLAAAAVVVVAGLLLGAIALRERVTLAPEAMRPAATATAPAHASTPAAAAVLLAQALATSNVYARPDRGAQVVAVLPGGQRAAVIGRSQDAEWLYITTPPASGVRGWVSAGALHAEAAILAALPVVDVRAVASAPPAREIVGALPDPALSEVFLLPGGQLVVGIRNLGPGALTDVTLTLSIAQIGGEVIGVFRIGPATLPAGGSATVVPPLTITEAGLYRFELDPGREVPDAQHSNNVIETPLLPSRG